MINTRKTFLLTWNPKNWLWENLKLHQLKIQEEGTTVIRWSCGNTKSIKSGDNIFLIRVGKDNPGIIGSGTVIVEPYQDQHYNKPDEQAWYIKARLDTLLNPMDGDPILDTERLNNVIPDQIWTPQASGISIKEDNVSTLERIWFEHLNNNKFTYNPFNELTENNNEGYFEGNSYTVVQTKYERNAEARRLCLTSKGYKCIVCSFDFEAFYGEIGKKFIHVHHTKPISNYGERYTDPETDLEPVCPNCHAMLHRKNPLLSIEELKNSIRR